MPQKVANDIIIDRLNRHDQEIDSLLKEVRDLATTHQEYGFLLKTYMEKFHSFDGKIDHLTMLCQERLDGKEHWDFKNKVSNIEKRQELHSSCMKWIMASIIFIISSQPHILIDFINFWKKSF